MAEGKATDIMGEVSNMENVAGGYGNDVIIGDDKNNMLDGGPGNNYLDGREGDDRLYITGGHSILIGGDGFDKAVVNYDSTYEIPNNDIEELVLIQPPTERVEGYSKKIARDLGGIVYYQGVVIIIPPLTLPGDAVFSVKWIPDVQLKLFNLLADMDSKMAGYAFDITASGQKKFGKGNFIEIRIPFEKSRIAPGERPVVHYYNPDLGKWVPIKTEVEYDEENGLNYAVIRVNHLTMFAVFSTRVEERFIKLIAGEPKVFIDNNPYSLPKAPFIEGTVNRTMAPVRSICEAMGAEVEWVQASKKVIIRKDDIRILLTIGSKTAFINNEIYIMDAAPTLQLTGTTFAPLRFICESLGAAVDYNNETREIIVRFDFIQQEHSEQRASNIDRSLNS